MDINDLRSIMTVVSLATFVGIIWWAFGNGRQSGFDDAANLLFADKDVDEAETRLSRRD